MRYLIDLRTGEPVLNLEGNMQEINLERSFYQYLDCLFHTPILSEPNAPQWGLDWRSIIEASANPAWEQLIQYIFLNALSRKVEPLVESIEAINLTRDGRDLTIEVKVTSTYGTTASNLVTLSE